MLRPGFAVAPVFPAALLLLASIAGLAGLAGCVADNAKVSEPPATCAKVGDICTFSPGKLGLCVESTADSTKLICQSQH
jgi:hypothetical protein